MPGQTEPKIDIEDKALHGERWVRRMLEVSTPLEKASEEEELISTFINAIYETEQNKLIRRLLLAATFDLVVAAEYYRSVAHVDWVYCPEGNDVLLLYPYTNACPRCLLQNKFIFHPAKKPSSGVIGARTSRLLAIFLKKLFEKTGKRIEIRRGKEPVDIILVDRSTNPLTVLFGEIKAAPLVTLPLTAKSQRMHSESDDEEVEVIHAVTNNPSLYGTPLGLLVPTYNAEKGQWQSRIFSLGVKNNREDVLWAYRGLANLFASNTDFLTTYLEFWRSAHTSYGEKNLDSIYWLLNASGQPSPRPNDWPQRKVGIGHESISDSKTSVGMDRTDDLKKGTYQVLKMGAEGKPTYNLSYKVAIISNIHALRHFDEYLGALKDIVWTRDETASARTAKELDPDTPLFNLFDGIIALTETVARDQWVQEVFEF